MKVSIKNVGPCRQAIKVEVPAECVATERAELLKYYTKGVSLPGFRKGHAPKELVENRFSKELAADLKDRIVPKFYHEAVEKEKIKVVTVVEVSEPELTESQSLKFEVTVDVSPEFKLPKYEQISVQVETVAVSEKQIDEAINGILRQHATYEEVEGRAAQEKDRVQISFESTLDGCPLEEKVPQARGLGRGNGYWISCDEESFLPGMGQALIGSRVGDKKAIPVNFPDSFIVKELAGIQTEFRVEITGMREPKMPKLDEDFLKQLHVESEPELRKDVRRHLEEAAQNKEKIRQQDAICDVLLEKTKLHVPKSAIDEQARLLTYEMARQRLLHGMSHDQIKAQRDDMMKEALVKAEEQVKLRYIIMAIADVEHIQVADQDVSDEIVRMAVQQRRDAGEYRKELEKEDRLESVREQLRFGKTMEFLLEKAKIKSGHSWWNPLKK